MCRRFALFYALFFHSVRGQNSPVSPDIPVDVICHTSDPSECYPAVFRPTENFQPIHKDQSIPAGLHVRINLATGSKEARLNLPEPPRDVGNALVMLESSLDDPPHSKGDADTHPFLARNEQVILDPSASESVAEDQKKSSSADSEGQDFEVAVARILAYSPTGNLESVITALDLLTEFAHDAEWGLRIAQQRTLSTHLLQYLKPKTSTVVTEVRSYCALALGTALQNNDKARDILLSQLRMQERPATIVRDALAALVRDPEVVSDSIISVTYAGRLIFLLSQLCQDPDQLLEFVGHGGFTTLKEHFQFPTNGLAAETKTKLRVRIANLVVDFAPAMAQNAQGRETLASICGLFSIDASAQCEMESVEFASIAAARVTLREVMEDRC